MCALEQKGQMMFTIKAVPAAHKTQEQAKFWRNSGSSQEKWRAWRLSCLPDGFQEARLDLGSCIREIVCYSFTVDPAIEFI